ncbi:hypothetical protein KM043_002034 [Ampulex compressa]|nr:hypothetical protein KM043_002034 [Ampulex compressa]
MSRVTVSESMARTAFESLLSEDSSDDENPMKSNGDNQQSTNSPRVTCNEKSRDINFEDNEEVVLSVIWTNDRVGAVYYNIVTSELFVMEDIHDNPVNFDITRALYWQCQPRRVVTITGMSESFINTLKQLIVSETLSGDGSSSSSEYRAMLSVMPKKDHSYENCHHRVRFLNLESEPSEATNAERVTFLNGILDFKSRAMIHALGLLLIYIDKHWNNIALEPSGRATYISLNHITLHDLVMVDEDTYRALNIVQAKYHPSLFKYGTVTSKMQGVSLYAFLNRCQSRPGAQHLWRTLRHPTRNVDVLQERFKVVEFFMDPNNRSVMENLTSCLRNVHHLTSVMLGRYSGSQSKVSDWRRLHKTLMHVIYIADICGHNQGKMRLFKRIADSITNEMQHVKYFIEYLIDFEASKPENHLNVRSNVDPLLDELNHIKEALPHLLTKMGEKDMQEHLPPYITECNMLYLPNIGYVLAIKAWNATPPEDEALPGLEFRFTINGVRYYKSPCARELDATIGDIMLRIAKRQSQIMLKLVRYVLKHAKSIQSAIQLCAELDTLLSFYLVARDYNYVKPNIVEDHIIAVDQGRHPLQEFLTTFIPNDIYSGGDKSTVKILTGANACGKSVYLKQVGLIVFMAHIGCYVPAKSATIGVVTHILTQIISVDSVVLNASTFLQDLRQINTILRVSTPNSLVLIDEFGKGTSETSGLALLAAVLRSFTERETYCPHVFAATHIRRVISLMPQTSMIQVQTFEFVAEDEKSVAFLYRLIDGSSTCSYAHSIAKSAGLDEKIVTRGLEVYEKIKEGSLPPPLPDIHRKQTAKHIVERIIMNGNDYDLEELKSWVRQTILPSPLKQ